MDGTLWWEFEGTGGPLTVSSSESNVNRDTVLAVYEKASGLLVGCNDDIQSSAGVRPQSEMLIDTVAGRRYLAQLGGCANPTAPPVACYGIPRGEVRMRVSAPPSNDDRSAAFPIAADAPVNATNTGATVEPGEKTKCGTSDVAKTIWFRFEAPAVGQATFSVAGTNGNIDTVMSIYREDESTPVACNDDSVADTFGGSRIPPIQPAGTPLAVAPGGYLIQVGGFRGATFGEIAAYHGALTLQIGFAEDTDVDRDGYNKDVDCQDIDPLINPGATEVPNNYIDENCDGQLSFDFDGDGFLGPPGTDCDDGNPAVYPSAPEILDNGTDEDCDGRDAATTPLPTPRIDASYEFARHRRSGLVTSFAVSGSGGSFLPIGTTITLRCQGTPCRQRHRVDRRTLKQRARRVSLLGQLRATLPRSPRGIVARPGATIDVRLSKPGRIGFRLVIRITTKGPRFAKTCLTLTGAPRARC